MGPGWSKALNSVLFFVFFLILGSLLVNVAHSQAKKRTVVLTDHLPPLEDFLEDAGLSSYYDSFLKHGFDEMQYVMRMTDKDMRIMELEKDEMAKLKSLIAGLKIEEELEIQVADPLMELRNKQEYGRMYVNRFVQSFEFLTAYFGAPMPTFSGTLAISDPWDGCAPQVRPHVAAPGRGEGEGEGEGEGGQEGAGGVFLLVGRGNCSFLEKMGNLSASPGPLPAALLLVAPNETVVRPATGHMPGPRHQQEEDTGIHVPEEVAVAMLKGSAYAPLVNAIQEDNEGGGGAGVGARLVPLQCRAGRAECLPVLEGERALPPQVDAGRISLLPPGEGDATGAPFIEFMSSTFGGRLPRGALPAALAPGDGRLCAPPPPPAAAAAAAAAAAPPAAALAGRAVVVERGGCSFGDKAWYAQNASARAVIIVDTTDQPLQNVAAAERHPLHPLERVLLGRHSSQR